jgi:hypothetical protein
MIQIPYVSGLRLEERKDPSPLGTPEGMFLVYGSLSLLKMSEVGLFVLVGDTRALILLCVRRSSRGLKADLELR